ncbi:MAG TPA: FAD-dependent oxidoreductase [Candidatus Thermoplasmatota archaeon]|nr:FAD-dependent oxidoreductase [Candidatus Thermoplasmatota archaeon]
MTPLTANGFEAPLVERREVAQDTMAFRFHVTGHAPHFQPGQACDVTLPDGQRHAFAIASSPTNARTVMIAARMRDTPFKETLRDLPFGAAVHIGPPTGTFTLPEDPMAPVVFLAGGIGITPFRSMLKAMLDTGDRRPVTLLCSNPTPQATAFLDELEAWQGALDLTLVPTITKPETGGADWKYEEGRIDAAMLQRHVRPDLLAKAIVYISGPPAMVQDMAAMVRSLGVRTANLKLDEFRGY